MSSLITISRGSGTLTFPADFILIGAMNRCPCGYVYGSGRLRTGLSLFKRFQAV